jgi:small subunit ribosomal protein S1
MDGLIHISELSWSHVNHPSEVLEIGQTVKVKVLDIDRDRQRISLGLKQTQSDPWQQVLDSYSVNDVVQGRVTKVVTFGAFVEILPGVEGLVHISELAAHHVENPREIVSQGDVVNVKVIEMDAERRRLSLSLKRVEGEEPRPRPEGAPPLRLSEEVFSETRTAEPEADAESVDPAELVEGDVAEVETEPEVESEAEPSAEAEAQVEEPQAVAEPEPEPAPEPEAAPDGEADAGEKTT